MLHLVTMNKQKIVRMKYSTFLRIKRLFPGERGETMAHYFERLAKFIERLED